MRVRAIYCDKDLSIQFNLIFDVSMTEAYLFYSSLTLLAMGCLTLVLSASLRLKHYSIDSLPKNLSASIFDKTFNVLNPYPERRKIIHSFVSALPLITVFLTLGLLILLWKVLEYGLMLSLFLVIFCLNLMLLEVTLEIYQIAKVFIKAVHRKADFGFGDIKVLQTLKNALPKLSNYYLFLSILFLVGGATLSYIWPSILLLLSQVIGLILETSLKTGLLTYQTAVALFALILVIIQIFAVKLKNRFLKRVLELPSS